MNIKCVFGTNTRINAPFYNDAFQKMTTIFGHMQINLQFNNFLARKSISIQKNRAVSHAIYVLNNLETPYCSISCYKILKSQLQNSQNPLQRYNKYLEIIVR